MRERLAALLRPPRFEDEDRDRRAALLHTALLVLMVSTVLWIAVTFHIDADPGTVIELSEVSGPKGTFFRYIAQAARSWDGSEAIRRMG